jgi:3-phosphoshikimate 1-carboxyvinyltransferase
MSSIGTFEVRLRRAGSVTGERRVPGDKSVSHRAAICGALAGGTTRISGFAGNLDCAATLACVSALGAEVTREGAAVRVVGVGSAGFREPGAALDARNSGTTMRLLAGALAGQPLAAELTGDASLRSRPMERVARPLGLMGAQVETTDGRAPLRVRGRARLRAIECEPDPPSAQVKSAILLAGLSADGVTCVRERIRTRDHTERLLGAFAAECGSEGGAAWVRGPVTLRAAEVAVPGDFSSAAFLVALALMCEGSDLTVLDVGLNPTRSRLLDLLADLGAPVETTVTSAGAAEPFGDLRVRYPDRLSTRDGRMLEIGPDVVAEIVDEVPVLAALATRTACGVRFTGAGELRRKESDRIAALAEGLSRLGAHVETTPDSLTVYGGARLAGAHVRSWGDHRIAMALACAAMTADGETVLEDPAAAAVSFPDFFANLPTGAVLGSADDDG